MGGRDEIDVVAASTLQVKHDLRQLPRIHGLPFTMMVDLPTLAELAEQIAPGDKNRARPSLTRQRRFLPKMRKGGRHQQLVARVAEAKLATTTLHPAISWAQRARAHEPLQGLNASLQLACLV
jgi:hypothetical protein